MTFFFLYLKQRRKLFFSFFLFVTVFLVAFLLYHLPAGAVLYPASVCILLGLLLLIRDYIKAYGKHRKLTEITRLTAVLMENVFPAVRTTDDADYQEIIQILRFEQRDLAARMDWKYAEMRDYYTVWAHQIKTPISSMRLHLQNEDSALSRKLTADLFRIEQYVEMVMMFLRLDSDTTDYVLKTYELDSIVRECVKKFAGEFIGRKLKLHYEPLHAQVLTDEKWLSFVIEQVLSNALKYTPSGSITVDLEEPQTLCIRDTGIGIAPEDLPRIFEKGYTGYNGRSDRKSSGIGLYLCRRVCNNLGHTITASSSFDSGTVIRIGLERKALETE